MPSAPRLFTEADHKRVTEAVLRAESKTAAEIIPVVATDSGRYDRAEDMFGLWLGLAALCAAWSWAQGIELSEWGVPTLKLGLPWVVGIIIGGWLVGSVIAHHVSALRRLFTPRSEQRAEVERTAREVFFDRRVHHTQGSSGLLIYISLLEHMAVVLADEQVQEKLGQQRLDALCNELVARLHKGERTEALCHTIDQAGLALAEVLPRVNADRNELSDALVVLD
jgi:putative membrane protein